MEKVRLNEIFIGNQPNSRTFRAPHNFMFLAWGKCASFNNYSFFVLFILFSNLSDNNRICIEEKKSKLEHLLQRGRLERFTTWLSKPNLDRLLNKALPAPPFLEVVAFSWLLFRIFESELHSLPSLILSRGERYYVTHLIYKKFLLFWNQSPYFDS